MYKRQEIDDIKDILDKVPSVTQLHQVTGAIEKELEGLKKRKDISEDTLSRIADLEVKMAKLWALLVETTPMGKEKLSKFGRRFGGKSKQDIR